MEQNQYIPPYRMTDDIIERISEISEFVREAGVFRSGGVGVYRGDRLIRMAPCVSMVAELIANLFTWVKSSRIL